MHIVETKAILVFLPAHGETFWWLLPTLVSLLSSSSMQPENTYFCILKVTDQIWESQKRVSIKSNHSYHQRPEAVSNFNQPNRKRWGVRLVNIVKQLPQKVFLLWHHHYKGGQPRLKRHPWGKSDSTGHQPSISMFGDFCYKGQPSQIFSQISTSQETSRPPATSVHLSRWHFDICSFCFRYFEHFLLMSVG